MTVKKRYTFKVKNSNLQVIPLIFIPWEFLATFVRPLNQGNTTQHFYQFFTVLIKTKKYKLEPALYIKTAMLELLKKQWWFIAGPIAIAC